MSKRIHRMSARLTNEEREMITAYKQAVHRDDAGLVRHAVFSLLRQDRRRVPERFHALLFPEDT